MARSTEGASHNKTNRTKPKGKVESTIAAKNYVRPDALVSTGWLADHLNDPDIRITENDEDVLLYDIGRIPNAQKVDWVEDLNDHVTRDYIGRVQFEQLLRTRE